MKKKPIENIVGKGENAGGQYFLLSHNVFYPSEINFHIFSHICFVVCQCFQFGPIEKFVMWKQQILFSFKQIEFAVDNFEFDVIGLKFSEWVENNVGNGEISPFPTVFSKGLHCRHVKTRACLGKG